VTYLNTATVTPDLIINHHGSHGFTTTSTIVLYLRVVTKGMKETFKKISIQFTIPVVTEPEPDAEVEDPEEEVVPEEPEEEEPEEAPEDTPPLPSTKLGVLKNPWVEKIGADYISKQIEQSSDTKKFSEDQIIDPEPVILKIGKISRNGIMKIVFN
jgi:hypothetical protein